jgi:hypothetical protein
VSRSRDESSWLFRSLHFQEKLSLIGAINKEFRAQKSVALCQREFRLQEKIFGRTDTRIDAAEPLNSPAQGGRRNRHDVA